MNPSAPDSCLPSGSSPNAPLPKPRRHSIKAFMRLAAYGAVVSAVLGTFAARSAYGDIKESALVVGRQLSQFGDLPESAYRVRLNGEPIQVASAMVDGSVSDVLDRFQKACEEHAWEMTDVFEKLPQGLVLPGDKPSGKGLGVIREQRSGLEGMVACLANPGPEDWNALPARVEQFLKTGDLASLGNLRYVYAEQKGPKAHVVTVWTQGAFHLTSMVPSQGHEAPGSDSPNVPRPSGATRLLSAEVEGAPYAVRIYEAGSDVSSVLQSYDQNMPSQGWEPMTLVSKQVENTRAFSRQGVDLLVFANARNGRAYVSVVEMRPR